MPEPATAPTLTIGPPPPDYTGGPVTVLYQPAGDTRPPDTLKTCTDLAEAIQFAETTVENGFIHGALTFTIPGAAAPTALEQQVAAEQEAYEASYGAEAAAQEAQALTGAPSEASSTTATSNTASTTITTTKPPATLTEDEVMALQPFGAADLHVGDHAGVTRVPDPEPTASTVTGYSIVRIPPNAPTKTEHDNLTLAQARELFKPMRCRGGAIIRILNPDGQVVDTKTGTLAAVAEPEPAASGSASTQVEKPAEAPETDDEPPLEDEAGTDDEGDAGAETNTVDPPEGPEEPTGQKTLIDRTEYDREDLQLPKVDGQPIDRIALTFSGTVYLDRSDPADVALYRSLTLQKDVTLMIEGKSNSTGAKGATDREGDLDVIIGTKGVKVATVYVPQGEAA